jgi:hypothetical protein
MPRRPPNYYEDTIGHGFSLILTDKTKSVRIRVDPWLIFYAAGGGYAKFIKQLVILRPALLQAEGSMQLCIEANYIDPSRQKQVAQDDNFLLERTMPPVAAFRSRFPTIRPA